MRILTVNVGSSSLKVSVLEEQERLVVAEEVPLRAGRIDESALAEVIGRAGSVDAVGHRIVHGGSEFIEPVIVDDQVRRRLETLVDLAPLHLPASLSGLDVMARLLPEAPGVACFDTAFHSRMPAAAFTYALPAEWRRRWPLRRFGFHGLSHAYAAARVEEFVGTTIGSRRVVTCHLGAGASLAAVVAGVSVDTTMGFTPLDGLVMATRAGSLDPGLVLWLEEHAHLPPAELASMLEHRSGLLGLSGSADLRMVLEAEERGDAGAILAVEVYLHRLRGAVATMAAAMNGLDAIVFTGGVGEHAPSIRARAAAGLGFLGIEIDPERNDGHGCDYEIGTTEARVRAFVVTAREDVQIARDVRRALASNSSAS